MRIDRIINTVFTSNTYVLQEEESLDCWLIDLGDWTPVMDIVGNRRIAGVFFTHIHFDHIYGILQLLDNFPECFVYTSEFGKLALASSKLNFSKYHEEQIIIEVEPVNLRILHDGDKVILNENSVIEVFETPGHDMSCLTYRLGNVLFSGDSMIPGVKTITSLPRSNKIDAVKSEKLIKELWKECYIYPGHGEFHILFDNCLKN